MNQLHVLAGSNGAGKTTLYERVLRPATGLPFVNADEIAKVLSGGSPITDELSAQAAALATERRTRMIAEGESFITETVFSHPSKVEMVRSAVAVGYAVHLHVVVVPEDLTVARVGTRVSNGGHPVPENKIRERYRRLWPHVADAMKVATRSVVYDNSRVDSPYRPIAWVAQGHAIDWPVDPWPEWAPVELHPDQFAQP